MNISMSWIILIIHDKYYSSNSMFLYDLIYVTNKSYYLYSSKSDSCTTNLSSLIHGKGKNNIDNCFKTKNQII